MIESKYLKDSIQNIKQLLAIPSLRKFETANLGKMLRLSKIRQYEDGEIIIKEGGTDPWFYFLLSGAIRIEKDGVTLSKISKMGEIFGEMRILDKLTRSASVYAEGKTICLAVNTAATERLPSDDETANFLLLLYKVFAEYISIRLRLTNEELIKTKKQLEVLTEKIK
ncbi:MAG: cyclic nucleotide-binding domain-containing protein [Desulfobacteraceae bacterium]|nr:cyclic nucleotide-binding domain-containing protein [Desulfobacteraceae bacterium]